MRFLRLFKKPDTVKLPVYDKIDVKDIPPASVLLFYGGPRVTEVVGNRMYGHKYDPPAFHAALYMGSGEFLNVGRYRTIENVSKDMRSSRRLDVIVYKKLTQEQGDGIVMKCAGDVDKKRWYSLGTYAWSDFLRFGIKWWHPSKKQFCSEHCVERFGEFGVRISEQESFNTAPWDLLEFAEKFPELCEIRTLWIGADFDK